MFQLMRPEGGGPPVVMVTFRQLRVMWIDLPLAYPRQMARKKLWIVYLNVGHVTAKGCYDVKISLKIFLGVDRY